MGRVILTVLLVLLATGCARAVDDAPPLTEQQVATVVALTPSLRIDENLHPQYQDAAVFAAESWRAAGFPIDVAVTDSASANFAEGNCVQPDALGCAWPGERVVVDIERRNACRWAKVNGMTRCVRMEPRFLALHEVGHWLGIEQHLPEGNVMQPALTVEMPPAELTNADVEALRAAQSSTSSVTETKSPGGTTPTERQ